MGKESEREPKRFLKQFSDEERMLECAMIVAEAAEFWPGLWDNETTVNVRTLAEFMHERGSALVNSDTSI